MTTWLLALLGAFVFAMLLFYAKKNTHRVVFNKISLPIRVEKTHSPTQLRVLHLSDLHMEKISVTPAQLHEQLKNEQIDIIALTGDYLDQGRSIPKFIGYLEMLQQLPTRHGMYAVFGNHDYLLPHSHFRVLKEILSSTGCKVMHNEHVALDLGSSQLNIIGIDDFSTRRSKPDLAFHNVQDGINLVLTHDPNLVLHLGEYDYDYLLSGHFHGGQIHWPRPYHLAKMGKLPRMNVIRGLHFLEEKAFYISEGLGQTALNIRLRSRPEITLHTLSTHPELFHSLHLERQFTN